MTSGSHGFLTCSALEKRGIEEVWQAISDFQTRLTDSGRLKKNRQLQAVDWLQKQTEEEALHLLFAHADFKRYFQQTLLSVKKNDLSPRAGLRHISEFIQHHYFE
ncbi:Probable GTPase ArgK [Yokenella regensburgei]|nr:Probable GTPase ArgK [Yokenella regensburgei]